MPIAATAKIVAAVVSPTTLPRSRRITPAPRNPIPCTMFDAMRVVLESPVRRAISMETMVNRAAPSETQNPVRIPEGRLRILRSRPMIAPSNAAHARRATIGLRGSMSVRISQATAGFYTLQFELRQFREVPCPGVYLIALQNAQPGQPKPLHRKAPQHRAINHGPSKRRVAQILGPRKVSHEPARKTVARPGRIMRFLQRKRRYAKYAAFVHHHGPVLSALYHQGRRTHFENML